MEAGAKDDISAHEILDEKALRDAVDLRSLQRGPKRVDFSGPKFALRSLSPSRDGRVTGGFTTTNLIDLDLSANQLVSDDNVFATPGQFESLQRLFLGNNRLLSVNLVLSRLRTLNLASNQLSVIPPLRPLVELESVDLSHNVITGDLRELMNLAPSTTTVNLTNNRISVFPSEYATIIAEIAASGTRIETFNFAHNPFSNACPEYVKLTIAFHNSILRVDNFALDRKSKLSTAREWAREDLSLYDAAYTRRQELQESGFIAAPFAEAIVGKPPSGAGAGSDNWGKEFPSLTVLAAHYESALRGDDVLKHLSLVSSAAEYVANSTVDKYELAFSQNKNISTDETISIFLQPALLLLDRVDSTGQATILRTLSLFSCVPNHFFGEKCLVHLRVLLEGGPAYEEVLAKTLREICISTLSGQTTPDSKAISLIRGLSTFPRSQALVSALGVITRDVCIMWENSRSHLPVDSRDGGSENLETHLVRLLALLLSDRESALQAVGEEVHLLLAEELAASPHTHPSPQKTVALLRAATAVISVSTFAVTALTKAKVHADVVYANLKPFFTQGRETAKSPLEQAEVAAAQIEFLGQLASVDRAAANEIYHYLHFVDLLLVPLKEYCADPVVLCAALDALVLGFHSPDFRGELLDYTVEQTQKFVSLLAYLGGRTYEDVCFAASRGQAGAEERLAAPPLHLNSDRRIHALFQAIVHFMETLLLLETDAYILESVNAELKARGRDRALLQLTVVPSLAVKATAIGCLRLIPVDDFEATDVQIILNVLHNFQSFETALGSDLIRAVLSVLTRFVEDPAAGAAGSLLRREKPRETFEAVFNLLVKATLIGGGREKRESDARAAICDTCVEFLRCCSKYNELRGHLRSQKLVEKAVQIHMNEDQHCANLPDVLVERAWQGRDVVSLLKCLPVLTAGHRIAFRLLTRIADVLEGRPELEDLGQHLDLKLLCAREAERFDNAKLRRKLGYLDPNEWESRQTQQTAFVNERGVDILLGCFGSQLADPSYADRNRKVVKTSEAHSEYWAGRLKGDIITAEEALERGRNFDESLRVPRPEEFYPSPPDYYANRKRWYMMQSAHRWSAAADESSVIENQFQDIDAAHASVARFTAENVSLGGKFNKDVVSTPYNVAAVLRVLRALVVVPTDPKVFQSVAADLKNARRLRQLIGLLEVVPLFTCDVGAKFLSVIRHAYTLPTGAAAESMDAIIPYDITFRVLGVFARSFSHILYLATARSLDTQEQLFATELAKVVAVLLHQTALVKFSEFHRVQQWAVRVVTLRFATIIILDTVIRLLVFDFSMAANYEREIADGKYEEAVATGFAFSSAYERLLAYREDMRLQASAVLSQIVTQCEPLRYSVFRALNEAKIFEEVAIRDAFIADLLENANLGHFRVEIQFFLTRKFNRAERVLGAFQCTHWRSTAEAFSKKSGLNASGISSAIYVISNYCTYVVEKPSNFRAFYGNATEVSGSLAAFKIRRTLPFSRLVCAVHGTPPGQLLFLISQMTQESSRMSQSGGDTATEVDTLMFERVLQTSTVLRTLFALRVSLANPLPIRREVVLQKALKEHLDWKRVIIGNLVFRDADQPTIVAALSSTATPTTAADKRLVFHALTPEELVEFDVDWSSWFLPHEKLLKSTLDFGDAFEFTGSFRSPDDVDGASWATDLDDVTKEEDYQTGIDEGLIDITRLEGGQAALTTFAANDVQDEVDLRRDTAHPGLTNRFDSLDSLASLNDKAAARETDIEHIRDLHKQFLSQYENRKTELLKLTKRWPLETLAEVGASDRAVAQKVAGLDYTFAPSEEPHEVVRVLFGDDALRERWKCRVTASITALPQAPS